MFVIESVLEARLFYGNEICVITPYREQATMIQQALVKASANEDWFERGILDVHRRACYHLEVVTHTSKEHILKIAQTWQLCVLLWK